MNSKIELSDEDLILSARAGDGSALETLYSRHHDAGLRFARRLMGVKADAEDVAQEAFLKVAAAIGRGNGPVTAFRPYLLRAVSTAAADRWQEQAKETPTERTVEVPVEDPSFAMLLQRDDPELVMKAFQSLPLRWMTVLWHAEVEREPPRRIAPILGIEPGAVSALLLRARKGLREAYLSEYAQAPSRTTCEPTFPYLAATVLGTSSARDRRKVTEHNRECEDCAKVLVELTDVGKTMRGILAPLVLIPSGSFFPPGGLLPKYRAGTFSATLTAATVFVAAAAMAGTIGLTPGGTPAAVPASLAGSTDQEIPTQRQSPHADRPTTAAAPHQAPAAPSDLDAPSQNSVADQYNPMDFTHPRWVEARPVPMLPSPLRPPVQSVPPTPSAIATPKELPPGNTMPAPTSTTSPSVPSPSPSPSPTPTWTVTPPQPTPTPIATATPPVISTDAPTESPTPAPTPTTVPVDLSCPGFFPWCLGG